MWGPSLKYRLQGPGEGRLTVVFVSRPLYGWSPGHFWGYHYLVLLCLVTKLPLVGGEAKGLC
jgi:hypothetical protein